MIVKIYIYASKILQNLAFNNDMDLKYLYFSITSQFVKKYLHFRSYLFCCQQRTLPYPGQGSNFSSAQGHANKLCRFTLH